MSATLEYISFDPAACGFPRPRVPVLPQPTRDSFRWASQAAPAALLNAPNAVFFSRARYAMAQAYRLSGAGPDHPVLVPAYHCRTMLDPAITLGADILLYPLGRDLSPDIDGLAHMLRQTRQRPSALLATHFFGFAQPIAALQTLCEEHELVLIEDCSHALFLPALPGGIGKTGRYCVASPYKFFPIEDGGVLWANEDATLAGVTTHAAGVKAQIRGFARAAQRLFTPLPAPSSYPSERRDDAAQCEPSEFHDIHRRHQSNDPSRQYDSRAEATDCLRVSRILLRHTEVARIVERRRANYGRWSAAVAHLPRCFALKPELTDACVPYMFPLLIDRPDIDFQRLKFLGMPVWRWDDMAVSACDVAMNYRSRLLHLPCHQELSAAQMNWMIQTVVQTMNEPVPIGAMTTTSENFHT